MTKTIRKKADRGYLDADLWVPKPYINLDGVKKALTFEYFTGLDREVQLLHLYREHTNHLAVPREFWKESQFDFSVVDCRPQKYKKTGVKSRIQLDHTIKGGKLVPTGGTVQRDALAAVMLSRGGTLELACGLGKTVISLEAIARKQVPAIIAVDNEQLLTQWLKSINDFLIVPGGIGHIQGDTFDWNKSIVMATYQTLAKRSDRISERVRRHFGLFIADEAHHINAPTFSKAANMFYGDRLALTATPKRDDGLHIISNFHIGGTIYRNLLQELKPKIYFHWTNMSLDTSDPLVMSQTCSVSGQLNISKLATYFGQWRPRLDYILSMVRERLAEGRKILVLSNSVNELVNLLALWNGAEDLYSAVPMPTPADVGETVPAERLEPKELEVVERKIADRLEVLKSPGLSEIKKLRLNQEIEQFRYFVQMHECGVKVDRLWTLRQKDYRTKLLAMPSDAGLMIHKVPAEDRMDMLHKKRVTFAISKYGKEGLDDASLDTVLLCEPMSSKNVLQQVMGRVLRRKEGKKQPVVIVLEDEITPMIGMCKKMRGHLRHWPIEDGGPYPYEFVGYPERARKIR